MKVILSISADAKFTHSQTMGGQFSIKKNGKPVLIYTPTQHASTVKRLLKEGQTDLVQYLETLKASGAVKQQKEQAAKHAAHKKKMARRV